jgi:hypothetical protein
MKVASAVRHAELYPDRHLNVFVPFGTHDLDYNVTRALIATLRWSRPQITRDFLAEVVGVSTEASASFQYDLQASDFEDFDPSRAKRKVVLGISAEGRVATHLPPLGMVDRARVQQALLAPGGSRLDAVRAALQRADIEWDDVLVLAHALDELRSGSLPDGWIFAVDSSVCVLLEAKLLNLLHQEQLDRHAELWFGRKREGQDLVLTTWAKVAGFFDARRGDEDPRTRFLVGQLFDYLDLLGFAPFEGFKPYDFDGDTLTDSLPKFRRFVEEVRKAALAAGAPLAASVPTPTGTRIGFSNPDLLGEARVELLESGVRIAWRLGEAATGRFAGPAGVDAVLATSESSHRNSLAGIKLASGTGELVARVDRLVASPAGPVVDAETYRHAFSPDLFPDVLQELRLQHPAGDQGRTPRRGALQIERTIPRDAALDGRDAVIADAAKMLTDVARIAERVLAPS